MSDRIVIVGHSAVTCLGRDFQTTWDNLLKGRSGIARHPLLPSEHFLQNIGGIVSDSGPGSSTEDPALSKLGARFLHFSVEAARAAWRDAGLEQASIDRSRVAVVVGSALGGQDLLEAEQARMAKRKNLAISPFVVPGLIINQAAGQVAQQLGLYGPSAAPANACASGGHALALGAMFLRGGEADFAVCGAGESAFTPAVVNGFATMKALLGRKPDDRSAEAPGQASRPFSRDRAGFILSEGAGMVVLATEPAARKLGLTIQAEYLGHALNSDGFHVSLPSKEKIIDCLNASLNNCKIASSEIDYYNAHGTSTIMNDKTETEVLKDVFGDSARSLPVSSIKGALGHSLGAASAIEAAVCVRALLDQVIPPTINYLADPDLDLDYVPNEARPTRLNTVMSASFGFGGTNNALIFRRWN